MRIKEKEMENIKKTNKYLIAQKGIKDSKVTQTVATQTVQFPGTYIV